MKQFMMIFIGEDYADLGLSPEEMQNRMGKWFAWSQKMDKAGISHDGEALTSKIRRISGVERTSKDVASTELKEIVGGYYIVSANNFDEVEEIAKDFPDYDLGSFVEIREEWFLIINN